MKPTSRPPAIPKSASPASPGPFTAHPSTATSKASGYARRRSSTRSASCWTPTLSRPHLGQAHLLEGGLDECLRLVALGEVGKVLRQRAGVRADPHGDALCLGGMNDARDLVVAADVARVDPHGRDTRVDSAEREAGVEVD